MNWKDNIKDWYQVASKTNKETKVPLDKNFKSHMIKPCSMISIVGSTGSGKSTALLEFLNRKNESFYRIIVFSGSTTDEPLYNLLKTKLDGVEFVDDVDKLPELNDTYGEDDKLEKLIVFDDFINLKPKEKNKIQKWFNSARKKNWTCIAMIQNYTDAPIQMRRNTMYWLIFRLNDMNTINTILKNHNNNGDDKEKVKKMYFDCTSQPKHFFTLDLTPCTPARYRHCFTDIIKI